MKRLFVPFAFLALLSCSPTEQVEQTRPSTGDAKVDSVLAAISSLDFSMSFDGKAFFYSISPIGETEYSGLEKKPTWKEDQVTELVCEDDWEHCWDKIEKANILSVPSLVARQGDSLILKCGQDSSVVLESTQVEQSDDAMETFTFQHKYSKPDLYLVAVGYMEGSGYKLINQKTCHILDVSGIPIFSPNRQKALMVNADLMAGFDFNGLEMLMIENDSLVSVDVEKEIADWAIEDAFWISDDELKITQVTSDYYEDEDHQSLYKRYARLKVKSR